MPKEKPESFCLWACAISKSPFPRGVSHFTIIILGVKLSNGWNREVLHIVKIWCLLCKSYCPFEYERGLKRRYRRRRSFHIRKHPPKAFWQVIRLGKCLYVSQRWKFLRQQKHVNCNKIYFIAQSTQQRHFGMLSEFEKYTELYPSSYSCYLVHLNH